MINTVTGVHYTKAVHYFVIVKIDGYFKEPGNLKIFLTGYARI